jgi:hypothetical protein
MAFALRHPLTLLVVLVALLAAAGVFVFARPEYQSEDESQLIDFSKQHYYSPSSVRQAFATEGIRLREASRVGEMIILSTTPDRLTADALNVVVGPRTGRGSYGPELESYDERFGNVLVTYGGEDERVLDRVKAAVDALR